MNPITAPPVFRVVVLLTICLLPSVAAAKIPQFNCFFVFGDSLADNGNILIQTTEMGLNPPVPPSATPHRTYDDGRFSNGPVAFEYLWDLLRPHKSNSRKALTPFLESPKGCAINFAFGGTGTAYVDQTPGGFPAPGLLGQVELYRLALRGKKPPPHSLYAIVTGANDYGPEDGPPNPAGVVGNIEAAIASLYELGARHVLVLDLPDLGFLPANSVDPNVSAAASAISDAHNAEFDEAMLRLESDPRYPALTLIPIKVNPLFEILRFEMNPTIPLIEAFAPPGEMKSACLFINPAGCIDMPDFEFTAQFPFLFWDIVHPTTQAHRRLAEYIHDHLEAEYE